MSERNTILSFATLRLRVLALVAVLTVGFGSVYFLSSYIERVRPPVPDYYDDEDLAFKGSKLKGFTLGFDGLIADWYWMSALQYIGDKMYKSKSESINIGDLRPLNPRLLYPYLDNATDLDPRFIAAYSYGAVVLPAIDVDKAIALTQKGIANNPNEWRFYHYLGYTYWRDKQYEKASEIYAAGSKVEGAPLFMTMMAAAMKNEAGSRETARAMYRQMYDEGKDKDSKFYAELRLMELDSLDDRDAINAALASVKEKTGSCPAGLVQILPLLRNVKLAAGRSFFLDAAGNLVDPGGVPYVLDVQNCKAALGAESKVPRG